MSRLTRLLKNEMIHSNSFTKISCNTTPLEPHVPSPNQFFTQRRHLRASNQGDGMFPYGQEPMHVPSMEQSIDVCANSKKWLGRPPAPETNKWTSSLGWQTYEGDLTAWAMQASLEFGAEIEQPCKRPSVLAWNGLTNVQRACSMAILKSAFSSHAQTSTLTFFFCSKRCTASSLVKVCHPCGVSLALVRHAFI